MAANWRHIGGSQPEEALWLSPGTRCLSSLHGPELGFPFSHHPASLFLAPPEGHKGEPESFAFVLHAGICYCRQPLTARTCPASETRRLSG